MDNTSSNPELLSCSAQTSAFKPKRSDRQISGFEAMAMLSIGIFGAGIAGDIAGCIRIGVETWSHYQSSKSFVSMLSHSQKFPLLPGEAVLQPIQGALSIERALLPSRPTNTTNVPQITLRQ